MTLRERLQDDTTAAMRSGDALRRDTLRMVQNAVYNTEKARKITLTDDDILAVIMRETKTRRESVEAFRKGGREDLAAKEEAEIAILAEYLPQPLTEDELSALVDQGIAETGATSARDLGKVMGWISPRDPRPSRRQGRLRPRRAGARPAQTWPHTTRSTDLLRRRGMTMLARPAEHANHFTRRDAGRLILASILLIAAMSVILGLDVLPAQTLLEEGKPAPASVAAPRAAQYVERRPHGARARGRAEGRRAPVRLHDRPGRLGRGAAAARAGPQGRPDRCGVRGRRDAGGPRGDPRGHPRRRPGDGRQGDPARPRCRPLGGPAGRGREDPGHGRALRAPRHRAGPDPRRDPGPVRGRPHRAGGRARGGPDPAPDRPQLVVLRRAHRAGPQPRRRGRRRRGEVLAARRDDRQERRPRGRGRLRGHRPLRPQRGWPGRRAAESGSSCSRSWSSGCC